MEFNSLLAWKTEGIRLSFFTITAGIDHSKWWEFFTGHVPENTSSKPAMGEFVYAGPYGIGVLELRILPDRVDWVYGTNILIAQDNASIRTFNDELRFILDGLNSWMRNYSGKYSRLAFGTTLLNEVPDKRTGYIQLNELLPFMKISLDSWSDFYLQFNKPTIINRSNGDSFNLNRLVNYSAVHMQMMNFTSGSLIPIVNNYTRIDFDINTSHEVTQDFNNDDVFHLLDKLTDVVDAVKSASEA